MFWSSLTFLSCCFYWYFAVAKRLCPGLQIRLVRFDSGPRLHLSANVAFCNFAERNITHTQGRCNFLVIPQACAYRTNRETGFESRKILTIQPLVGLMTLHREMACRLSFLSRGPGNRLIRDGEIGIYGS